ncbi:MFS transporter [Sphingomonas sp.]|uniref:MFS transporter n=1 Tax=Sphingomonas sp. TaxID=28214 RepID=UPI003D6CA250
MQTDPRETIAAAPMGRVQIIAVALCVGLNALDGFDVLSISFASPGIAREWGIDRAALGLVLSMELIGMAVGSMVLGNLADRIGRRPIVLGCLVIMSAGMALATAAGDVVALSLFRLLTGFGIGGMLAATNAVVAEFANAKHRSLCVALMAAGYPAGAIIGGAVASQLLVAGDWRIVFSFGALVTAALLPLVWFLLPETLGYLVQRRPTNALAKVNHLLARFSRESVDSLPALSGSTPRTGLGQLFAPALAPITLLLTTAYFMHIMTFYFILKWIPKIVVDMGHAASTAGSVLVWANVGGLAGAVLLSFLTWRIAVGSLVIAALLASTVIVSVFGLGQSDLSQLSLIAAAAGFCTNAGVVGLYAIMAQTFPTAVRAGGTGFVIGVGRGSAALGPIIAGQLFNQGWGLFPVAVAMGLGSLVAAVALAALRRRQAAYASA